MKKISFLIVLLYFLICSKTESQIIPYIPIEFNNIEPVWEYVSIDSTLVDGIKYDGMTQVSPISDRPLPYLIHNNYLYIASNTTIETEYENEGGLIEKLDLTTGKSKWTSHFDLRNNDRYEYIESIFINEVGNLEVITDRNVKKPDGDHIGRFGYGDTAKLCIRNYDINSGVLINHQYPDSNDQSSVEIRYSIFNRTILFPLKNNQFQYIYLPSSNVYKQYLLDKNGHLLTNPMIDTVIFEKSYNPDSVLYSIRGKMLKISEDTLIGLDYLTNRNDYNHNILNPSFDKQTKLTLYDKNLKIKKVLKIDSLLPKRCDFLRLEFANKNHIGIYGRFKNHYTKRDTFFYTIFNWDGEVEKHFIAIYKNDFFSLQMLYLSLEQEYLGVGISDDKTSLMFFKTNSEGNLDHIKDVYFKSNGRVLYPEFIAQLDNGDILLKGLNKFDNNEYRNLTWQTWMRIKAKDLGLKSTSITKIDQPNNNLRLYPNPTNDILKIHSNNLKINRIKIYDLVGKLVMDKIVKDNYFQSINISLLLSGVYSVKCYGMDSKFETNIFIKE